MTMGGGWVLEVDIKKFFDTIDHGHLRSMLGRRVGDGTLLRLIGKWLNAGVTEAGVLSHPDSGTPQGGVISPILANIFLHEVLDTWFERDVRARLKGPAVLVRYADDFVILFEKEDDARRVMAVLPERFGKYGLTLHPEKTRLVEFKRPSSQPPQGGRGDDPGTFDLLGFTHYWDKSQNGYWVVKLKTAKGRFSRALKRVADWCRSHRHLPVRQQWESLTKKLRGHYQYFGVIGNGAALRRFRYETYGVWRCWLNRRSHRARMTWQKMRVLHAHYPLLPPPATLRPLRA